MTIKITIGDYEDWLPYIVAFERIQAIQQKWIRQQAEAHGLPCNPMDEGKACRKEET